MLNLRAQYAAIGNEVRAALGEVLASQQFVLGPQLSALEHELAQYGGRKYGIGVASGTDALILGLRACGVKPGDEVIVPAFTFIASAGAVSALGATPVFADCDADTLNVDPASVESLLTKRTAAILAVHLYGLPADLQALGKIAARRGIPLVEDNAQALGSRFHGRPAGSFGTVSATSFYPSKNLGAYGDAGMILTDSRQIAGRLAILRNHGQTGTYVSSEPGWNSRLDEMQAAVLRVKLRYLDHWIALRRVLATRYSEGLAKIPGITPLSVPAGREHTYYLYTVRVTDDGPRAGVGPRRGPGKRNTRRNRLREELAEQGIGSGVYYPVPLHLQPIYASLGGKSGQLRVAEQAAHEVLSLPIYPEMTLKQVDRVVYAVAEALRR